MKPKGNPNPKSNREKDDFPGYPHYDGKEDIYKNEKELDNVDPNDPTHLKSKNPAANQPNEKGFNKNNLTGGDLDVPGAELDDAQENIGSEDEENNYYSLGGDNHEK